MVSVFLASLAVLGCVSVPTAPPTQDRDAKAFTPKESVARVYVFRPGTQGAAGTYQIIVDGLVVGSLSVHSYLVFDAAPGAHVLVAAVPPTGQWNLEFTAEAGKLNFLRIGNFARLREDDEATGKLAIRGCCMLVQSLPTVVPPRSAIGRPN